MGDKATIDATAITALWDKVLEEVYQSEPRADAERVDGTELTTEAYVRDDNENKIAKAIKKAWKASRKLPLADLPDISNQGDWTDSYYMAVEDSQSLGFDDDDEVQEMLEEVIEFVSEWQEYSQNR
jgi:hypothetical protein